MGKTERAEMVSTFLRQEGFTPEIDADGDVVFKFEGGVYIVMMADGDEEYVQIAYPNFWSIESDEERERVIGAAVHATAQTKVAKVYPVRDNTWATVELFCSPPEGVRTVFTRSLRALQAAVATFRTHMNAAT